MAAHGLYTWDIVPNWSKIKYERMKAVLRAKFVQHSDLRELLLATGDARLVETGNVDNAVNRTWGEVNGKGRNILGLLLMELRTDFRADPKKTRLEKNQDAVAAERERIYNQESVYPCAECGKLRTKDQGGTTFTVCDACWDKPIRARRGKP
jgi:hypothetical protein